MSFMDRLAELRKQLHGDFIPAVEAARFVEQMEREHPDQLTEWMRVHAVRFCTGQLTHALRVDRQKAEKRASAHTFAAFAEEAVEEGNVESVFASKHAINPENVRRPVAEMTSDDHMFVSRRYAGVGKRALLLSEFHRAVAHKLDGRCTTADVFTEVEYMRLRDSIVRPQPMLTAAA